MKDRALDLWKNEKQRISYSSLNKKIIVYQKLGVRTLSIISKDIKDYFDNSPAVSSLILQLGFKSDDKHSIALIKYRNIINVFDSNGELSKADLYYPNTHAKENLIKILDGIGYVYKEVVHGGMNTYGGGNCDAFSLWYSKMFLEGMLKKEIDEEVLDAVFVANSKLKINNGKNKKWWKKLIRLLLIIIDYF